MKQIIRAASGFAARLKRRYFNSGLDFGMRIFNMLAVGGATISFIMAALSISGGSVTTMLLNFASGVLALMLLKYANIKGHFRSACVITVTIVFLGVFPALFFAGGGYRSGMPCFFIFAVVFTILMLNGRLVGLFVGLELVMYSGCCIAAYMKPELVTDLSSENNMLADIVTGFIVVSVVLGGTVYFLLRAYRIQQKKLDERNVILAGMNKFKAEMISNVSHEMKTPLTVVSVNVQRALDMLGSDNDRLGEARELLQNSQDEVMRLARMVTGALSLASARESFDKKPLDCAKLLRNCSETWRAPLRRSGNALVCSIPESLPDVYCDADQIAQVMSNLLSNSNEHTKNGTVRIRVANDSDLLRVEVEDSGDGIPPELMPHIFERGVSGRGGTGYGLCLCRAIVESHGGKLALSSKIGEGTSAVFEIPIKGEDIK